MVTLSLSLLVCHKQYLHYLGGERHGIYCGGGGPGGHARLAHRHTGKHSHIILVHTLNRNKLAGRIGFVSFGPMFIACVLRTSLRFLKCAGSRNSLVVLNFYLILTLSINRGFHYKLVKAFTLSNCDTYLVIQYFSWHLGLN